MPAHKGISCPTCGASLYAEGGEVADPSDFAKKDHDLPDDYRLPGYRGEEETPSPSRAAADEDEDEDVKRAQFASALRRRRKVSP